MLTSTNSLIRRIVYPLNGLTCHRLRQNFHQCLGWYLLVMTSSFRLAPSSPFQSKCGLHWKLLILHRQDSQDWPLLRIILTCHCLLPLLVNNVEKMLLVLLLIQEFKIPKTTRRYSSELPWRRGYTNPSTGYCSGTTACLDFGEASVSTQWLNCYCQPCLSWVLFLFGQRSNHYCIISREVDGGTSYFTYVHNRGRAWSFIVEPSMFRSRYYKH